MVFDYSIDNEGQSQLGDMGREPRDLAHVHGLWCTDNQLAEFVDYLETRRAWRQLSRRRSSGRDRRGIKDTAPVDKVSSHRKIRRRGLSNNPNERGFGRGYYEKHRGIVARSWGPLPTIRTQIVPQGGDTSWE